MGFRIAITALTLALIGTSATWAQSSRALGRTAPEIPTVGEVTSSNPVPPRLRQPIVNRMLDLLDEEIFLEQVGGESEWESPSFDTSQFNQLILKVDSQASSGIVSCTTEWSFGGDDSFVPGSTFPVFVGDDAQAQRFALGLTPQTVVGLRGRIRCSLVGPDFGGGGTPDPANGVISDVKVLLRRD